VPTLCAHDVVVSCKMPITRTNPNAVQLVLKSLWQDSLPVDIDFDIQAIQRFYYWALAATLIVAGLYLYLIVTIDNTNLGTTNGLWKSPAVAAWAQGKEGPIDGGEILYLKGYGYLSRLIPDDLVRYGFDFPFVTFRKMALLNGIFGAIASGFLFLLALGFSGSRSVAVIALLAHAGAAYVLLNSINSEDIIPAYAFFLGSTTCLFAFLQSGRLWLGATSAALLALATLFHWTLMGPGLLAFGAVFLLVATRRKTILFVGIAWLAGFLVVTQALVLLAYPSRHIPIWAVVFSAKADSGGWVGFHAEKLIFLIVGMGNYFSGGNNFSDSQPAFQGANLHEAVSSWIYIILATAACCATFFNKKSRLGLRSLALFAIVLLLVGECGAVYAQPADPQFQVQPLLATTAGVILLARWWSRLGKFGAAVSVACSAILIINGYSNVKLMQRTRGGDSQSVRTAQKLGEIFPKTKDTIVCIGWEGWLTWDFIAVWRGDSPGFLGSIVGLATPFTTYRGISGPDAATGVRKQIDAAMAHGMRVVAAALWTETPQAFVPAIASVADQSRARAFEAKLRTSYRLGQKWDTPVGPFVELLPAAVSK